ncbi:hypothetical protein [Sutcliffiella halmapala]|uniref:hypothetical protein n=1 Tax=Sutcliffiella halmapala TaxID=79882 RepID=UPI000994D4E5|nr:hypothetical protein [Sutcliffiella halmapala]
MNIKFTVYVSNMRHDSSDLLIYDQYYELDSACVTSEKTRYIPITHPEATKAALKTCEEHEGPALYIPGYVQLMIDNTEVFTEDDWTTDLLMTWKGFTLLLDSEYLDGFDEEAGVNITLLDNQTECIITNSGENIQLKVVRFLMHELEDETTIFESPLIPKHAFLNAIKQELKNVSQFLQSNKIFKDDSSYEIIVEVYNDIFIELPPPKIMADF